MRGLAAIVFVGLLVPGCGTDSDVEDLGATFDEDLFDEAGVVIEAAVPGDDGEPAPDDSTGDGKGGGRGNGPVVDGGVVPDDGGEGGEGGDGGDGGEGGKEDCPPDAMPL